MIPGRRTALSFDWLWDVRPDLDVPMWLRVEAFTGLAPSTPQRRFAGATYANGGSPRLVRVGEDVTVSASVRGDVDATGEFTPDLLALLDAADTGRTIGYRYYHGTSPSLAWGGTALVEFSRRDTGNVAAEFFDVTLTGQGDRARITTPGAFWDGGGWHA